MRSTEKLLDGIFQKGDHVTMLTMLGEMMKHGSPCCAIIDGVGEGAW